MNDYTIEVSRIEELQMLNDTNALDQIFTRARSAIVNGARTILVRRSVPFDELSNLADLEIYKKGVYKYVR